MIIRKLYKFENAHIVRNCSSDRCKFSIHGHSYKVEVILEGASLDNGQMLYDFGLMKGVIRDFLDSFDHATAFWNRDDRSYIESIKEHSMRWVSLPVSPSAEQFSRVFFVVIDAMIKNTNMSNGEKGVRLNSIIVHETDTGYAQSFRPDAENKQMGPIYLEDIEFSSQVTSEWADPTMYEKLLLNIRFTNPVVIQQV